jgi:imidazoleglycerol-phosphate dehydratase
MRKATINRKTRETDITIKLNIDGKGITEINTGIGILDHMLELFAFHGFFDLNILAKGDLRVDIHHTNEDIGIVLAETFKKALGKKMGIKRFGFATVPMEDVLASVAIDISGRGFFKDMIIEPYSATRPPISDEKGYSLVYANHFFKAFAEHLNMNLNINIFSMNQNLHTNLEPVFKALGLALDQATRIDPRRIGIPSTKGKID